MIKNNFKLSLVISAILFVLLSGSCLWWGAEQWADTVQSDSGWYSEPELSRMEVRDTYSLEFKRIMLIGGLVFASTFLLLQVIPSKTKSDTRKNSQTDLNS